jgi:hypothetical protein
MAELVRIGFNSEDRFMTAIGHTLAVITQTGDVFGADVVNRKLQPVFRFGGAKIGFNPEDRFVVTVGNTIVVITRDGRVFGSEVTGRELGPVFQFTGSTIGFNPQDRFMVAVGHTLVVITDGGSVFGADVSGRNIGPVSQFASATIGFNPQDRFMVAIGKSGGLNPAERPIGTLAVITNSGSVFGADIVSHQIGIIDPTTSGGPHLIKRDLSPVFQFGGAKIGFNPQDRFMVAMGQTLAVITSDGNVFGADVVGRDVGPVFQVNLPDKGKPPVIIEPPENPELGDKTGSGDDKNKKEPPEEPPPEVPTGGDNQPPFPPPLGCFIGDTPVLMADGLTRAIDAIAIGDQVMARDEKTGTTAVGAVTRIFRHIAAETLLLRMDGGEVVETTTAHRFAVEERGFVSAGQLRPGDRLSTHNDRGAEVVSTGGRSAEASVYNLSVDRFHTFFIGGAGLWVHNVKDSNPPHDPPKDTKSG